MLFAQTFTNKIIVNLNIFAQDDGCGIGQGSEMMFSNDGLAWSSPEPYNNLKNDWNLDDVQYGGNPDKTEKTVSAKVSDRCGNWSDVLGPARVTIDNNGPNGNIYLEFSIIISSSP